MNSVVRLAALAALCLVTCTACSSRSGEISLSPSVSEPPLAASPLPPASAPAHRPVRPIPDVISRPRPFRVADALGGSPAAARREVAGVTGNDAAPAPAARADSDPTDIDGIRHTMQSYLEAFNRHDAAALAAHWSEAGQNVDIDTGETTRGREAVREVFAALFAQDAAASIDIDLESIRPVRDDVAVIDGVSRLSFSDGALSSSRFSAVLVREAGGWALDSVRESAAPAEATAGPMARGTAARPLDELSWLVGSWEDVGEGVTASTQCFWAKNRAFLIRSHSVVAAPVSERSPAPGDDRIPGLLPLVPPGSREITEIIGWDPDDHRIRSWLFTSDGRFAEAEWTRDGDAWNVTIARDPTGTVPAGLAAAAAAESVYTITRVGADEMTCRLSGEADADILPPAVDFLRTARAEVTAPVVETP